MNTRTFTATNLAALLFVMRCSRLETPDEFALRVRDGCEAIFRVYQKDPEKNISAAERLACLVERGRFAQRITR